MLLNKKAPPQKKSGSRSAEFWRPRCILVAGLVICYALGFFLLHRAETESKGPHLTSQSRAAPGTPTGDRSTPRAANSHRRVEKKQRVQLTLTARGHLKKKPMSWEEEAHEFVEDAIYAQRNCNEYGRGTAVEEVLATLEGQCGQAEATAIRRSVDGIMHDVAQSTLPVAGSGKVTALTLYEPWLSALVNGNASGLSALLADATRRPGRTLQDNKTWKAEAFFTWGMPVTQDALKAVLGTSALEALERCQLVKPCSTRPDLWWSMTMLYPVDDAQVVIATDWPLRPWGAESSSRVHYVGGDSIALVNSMPPVEPGQRVLDAGSGSGIQGIVAATRGATNVTMVDINPRAALFARFNVRLNNVEERTLVLQADVSEIKLEPGFHLMLASLGSVRLRQNSEDLLKDVLAATVPLLDKKGVFALAARLANPEEFSDSICSNVHALHNIAGSVVRSKVLQAQVPDPKRANMTILNSMKSTNQDASYSVYGLIFGWRSKVRNRHKCRFSSVSLPDAAFEVSAGSDFDMRSRPCYWNRDRVESCVKLHKASSTHLNGSLL